MRRQTVRNNLIMLRLLAGLLLLNACGIVQPPNANSPATAPTVAQAAATLTPSSVSTPTFAAEATAAPAPAVPTVPAEATQAPAAPTLAAAPTAPVPAATGSIARPAGPPTMVFVSVREGVPALFLVEGTGKHMRRLTEYAIDAIEPQGAPAWSPDGQWVVFTVTTHEGRHSYLAKIRRDGSERSERSELSEDTQNDYQPSWSPDGQQIVFIREVGGASEVFVMQADGSRPTRLTTSGPGVHNWYPVWSPDGQWIAFTPTAGAIYLIHPDGSQLQQIAPEQTAPSGELRWSPDGRQLAFSSSYDNNGEIVLMTIANRTLTRLTHSPAVDYAPAWSPDGRRIAFSSRVGDATQIMVMDADGSNVAPLLSKPLPSMGPAGWSPDGELIGFNSQGDIYAVRADGSGLVNLTHAPESSDIFAWAP